MLGGLALGLVLLALPLAAARAATGSAAEYSGATLPGLASRDTPQSSIYGGGRVKTAQNDGASTDEDAATAEARKKLKKELDRMRRGSRERDGDLQPAASKTSSKKNKDPAPATAEAQRTQQQKTPAHTIDPEINRAAGKLIIMRFTGNQPSDAGPKAIRTLLQGELIAGAMFKAENIQSRAQLKELMKFFWQGGTEPRPVFAIREIGGGGEDGLPRISGFEAWPSEQEVAAKGDPEYAYLTYRSLSSNLASLGLNMNFGPALGAPAGTPSSSASFGGNPLQAGVFAKTFILGHKDDNIITVPIVDGSDISLRALKTLLVSYPGTPIAATMTGDIQPFAPYESLVRGPRFCFMTLGPGSDAAAVADYFNRGCDVLVVDGGKESPAVIRDLVGQSVSDAIKHGQLSLEALKASAQRFLALRSPAASPSTGFTTRTAQ